MPFAERRARLRGGARRHPPAGLPDRHHPGRRRPRERWFETFEGAGLDGVVAKAADLPYGPDQRLMTKIKHVRTADCVVAGFRWHKSGPIVGSLLLGPLQRRRRPPAHRGRGVLPDGAAGRAGRGAGALPGERRSRAPVAGLGRLRPAVAAANGETPRPGAADARCGQPVEREEGPLLGAAAARTGRGDQVRPARRPSTSSHRPVPPVAARPGPAELHVRPARGAGALRPRRGPGAG